MNFLQFPDFSRKIRNIKVDPKTGKREKSEKLIQNIKVDPIFFQDPKTAKKMGLSENVVYPIVPNG